MREAGLHLALWGKGGGEPERFIDTDDRLVVFQRVAVKRSVSGPPVEIRGAFVVTIADWRIAASVVFGDRAEALKAARLEA